MMSKGTTILIMAAGTGGHIFPALSIAEKLRLKGVTTNWLGTAQGMENKLLEDSDITLHAIKVKGVKGKGVTRMLLAPFMILVATIQAMRVISRIKPNCVLGMGGFVSGPGGLATKIMGKRLLIHEQNAVAGFTNRILSVIADRVLEAFPNTFRQRDKVVYTGNPVRAEISALNLNTGKAIDADCALRILVLGGSQGAVAINELIPAMLSLWDGSGRPSVLHQVGSNNLNQARESYIARGIELNEQCVIKPFIDDMSSAYAWADLVICRSGASTVSELAVAGLPSILVPYPYHSDHQQTRNALWLSDADAAIVLQQAALTAPSLTGVIVDLDQDRERLSQIGENARKLAIVDASEKIAQQCMEVASV
ncbi:MAG: undecaprenyldiphospho-muramoylpentapeptide beta-N-acetylglucosaminyltransferase [Gammaproteobacteria bacterium]|jgi:UDP-N-acetylglucosamine--N-acetylmuramyl-(pentapeptide) pyrophosphoryl-undecaprenol N-acetylglucosamine transferase|nr:undecaprenyldiphospho-muramoylpentapeptide beta-N-acetylglucosaminyltransferase [Gammaproteobacteria bacterium]MDP6097318.1 undecaprenyldiphospho-muramoylpentapeptide beta-N-acetylglucosaminyltransferase [Gammaproteobacteria bacterium]|tara:strand:- start:4853 stop:5953 length:1101 start_codon:yes stop_codon:yes gene_type:complete